MLEKEIEVDVDHSTWPRNRPMPASLTVPRIQRVDLKAALLVLGALTSPGGYSTASPARRWAWVRYAQAISRANDLRITSPYAELDPHQVSIISDNFGVAVPVQWLHDKLGGFREVIDGRLFAIQYSHLTNRSPPSSAKVGSNKCPDYVFRTMNGKWHVLECKGTQNTRHYRDSQLAGAIAQKRMIRVSKRLRGERLAAGLFLANENRRRASEMKIIDPDSSSAVTIRTRFQAEAIESAQRVMVARCLAAFGLYRLSEEIVLPQGAERLPDLLTLGELRRLRLSQDVRQARAVQQLQTSLERIDAERTGGELTIRHDTEFDQSDSIDGEATPLRRLRIEFSLNADYLSLISRRGGVSANVALREAEPLIQDATVAIQSADDVATLRYGNLFSAKFALTD